MDYLTIFLVAIGLSFDSFAVSVSSGLIIKKIDILNAIKIALSLSLFQALLPVIGWYIGAEVVEYIKDYDHWIAFLLLLFIGGKMIYDSLKPGDEEKKFNPLHFLTLITLSVATSIDALAVGFSFGLIKINIWITVLIIGLVTFLFSMTGILFGKKTGQRFGKKMEILGGIILIGIGIKILVEHSLDHGYLS